MKLNEYIALISLSAAVSNEMRSNRKTQKVLFGMQYKWKIAEAIDEQIWILSLTVHNQIKRVSNSANTSVSFC